MKTPVIYARHQKGFTLLELMSVVSIIGVLAAGSLRYYGETKQQADKVVVETLSHRFSTALSLAQAVQLTSAASTGEKQTSINFAQSRIYFNEYGWPANTSAVLDPQSQSQTALECFQLWNVLLRNPPPAAVQGAQSPGVKKYAISMVNGRKQCRYQLLSGGAQPYYFDYDLLTGKVHVFIANI